MLADNLRPLGLHHQAFRGLIPTSLAVSFCPLLIYSVYVLYTVLVAVPHLRHPISRGQSQCETDLELVAMQEVAASSSGLSLLEMPNC